MKVTIHQPEHFPYEGFFQKMKSSDLFVVLDNVKFRKNYFQNRNKFLNKQGSDEWFGIPVPKNSTSMNIKDVLVVDKRISNWRKKVLTKIRHNFGLDMSEVYQYQKLIDINMASIAWCRDNLKIKTPIVFASDLGVKGSKTSLLVNICKEVEATSYLSGPSGIDYLDLDKFERENIKVEFFKPTVKNYYSMIQNITQQRLE